MLRDEEERISEFLNESKLEETWMSKENDSVPENRQDDQEYKYALCTSSSVVQSCIIAGGAQFTPDW